MVLLLAPVRLVHNVGGIRNTFTFYFFTLLWQTFILTESNEAHCHGQSVTAEELAIE